MIFDILCFGFMSIIVISIAAVKIFNRYSEYRLLKEAIKHRVNLTITEGKNEQDR